MLLLVIGLGLAWVPLVGLLGSILGLVGAILVVLGRRAFGDRHALFVVLSVVIFVSSLALGFVLGFTFGFQAAVALQRQDFVGVQEALRLILGAIVALAAVGGIGSVLFVHELENRVGKYLLYAAYGLSIVVAAVIAILGTNLLATIGPGMTQQDLLNIISRLGSYQVLSVIPNIAFAVSYYLAYSRISRGDIPQRAQPVPTAPRSAAPAPVPPPPPAPPPPAPAPEAPRSPDEAGPPPEL